MLARRRILLVESDSVTREDLTGILTPEYEVIAASCGCEGLDALETSSFDLVLIGKIGAGPRDLTLLDQLSREPFRPKVIVLTAAWSDQDLDRAAVLRADAVLVDRDPGEVSASVAAHLGS